MAETTAARILLTSAEAKREKKRREVQVETCFADLLREVLRGWEGKKELALALDASSALRAVYGVQ